jgi:hypothetical protein
MRHRHSICFYFAVNSSAAHAQQPGRFGLVPARPLQSLHQQVGLATPAVRPRRGGPGVSRDGLFRRETLHGDDPVLTQDHGMFQGML